MSDLRLFDIEIDTDIDTDIEPGVELAPTLAIQPRTHMEPGIEPPVPSSPSISSPSIASPTVDSPTVSGQPFTVEVVRSTRRRRTISAQMHDGVLRISIPNWMSKKEELASVRNMVKRFEKKLATEAVDLAGRARTLAKAHDLRTPSLIEWNDSLKAVWGLCTPSTGHIRLSTRLVSFPTWVLDYVIVHELAHLHVSGHGPDFWALAHRYPRSERAIGYLIAKSGESPDSGNDGTSDTGSCEDESTSGSGGEPC